MFLLFFHLSPLPSLKKAPTTPPPVVFDPEINWRLKNKIFHVTFSSFSSQRRTKPMLTWLLIIVVCYFPESGLVLFMSLYHWVCTR